MDDAHDERFRQHEALIARLAFLLEAQHETNQALKAFNERQVSINQDVQITLARVESLLARMLRQDTNGTDA